MIKDTHFFKANALGNDFILIQTPNLDWIDSEFILKINNRQLNIGCNQVLAIDPDYNVKIWNEDGSEAKLCGNGLRCLAKLIGKPHVIFHTNLSGDVELKLLTDDFVSMQIKYPVSIKEEQDHYLVDVGNLNKVFFVENNQKIDIKTYQNTLFNYSFLSKNDDKWSIRTIESSSYQETLACGSAALASAYVLNHIKEPDLTVWYKLGPIEHYKNEAHLTQKGKVKIVAKIQFYS